MVIECKGDDLSPLAERRCLSAYSSFGPLTFDINGEILVWVECGAVLPRDVDVVLAFLRFYSSFHRKLPSAHS